MAKKILVIDDEQEFREIMKEWFFRLNSDKKYIRMEADVIFKILDSKKNYYAYFS